MKILAALTLTLLACRSEPPRRSAHADSGAKQADSTGGVRLKLAVASAPYRAGELPEMEAYIENAGSGFVTFIPEALEIADVEIDGVWHNVIYAGSCCMAPETLPPNTTRIAERSARQPSGGGDVSRSSGSLAMFALSA